MISVGDNEYVSGFNFPPGDAKLESSEEILLESAYVLAFVPIAEESGGVVELRVVSGSEDLLVRSFDVSPFRGIEFEERLKRLSNPVIVDLSPFRNRSVRMVWSFHGPARSGAALARVKLRRRDRGNDSRPDILLVCSDTHRFDYATAGKGQALMPQLGRLASDSIVYERAYSPASWTLPSIVSTLTGLNPRRHLTGRRSEGKFFAKVPPSGNMVFRDRLLTTYPEELETVSEKLQAEGYTTVLISGNWFYFGSDLFADGHDFAFGGRRWPSISIALDASAGEHPNPGDYRSDGASLNRKARAMLRELPSEDPLLMIVHYLDVHDWGDRMNSEPGADERTPDKTRGIQIYEEEVRNADKYLGELIDVWSEERGYAESVIVFFSDHGEHLFDQGELLYHGHTMGEALLHVPLVVKYPSSIDIEPHVSSRMASLIDLAPTLVDLVGAEKVSGDFDGISLLDSPQTEEPRTIFADYQLYGDESSSVRRGPMKLVINLSRNAEYLVDLRKPYNSETGERGQFVVDADVQQSLREAFKSYSKKSRESTRGMKSHHIVDPDETLEQLRLLGYVE